MPNWKYLIKRALNMDYANMVRIINGIHKKTGRGYLDIVMDIKDCAVKYGAGYCDYDLFEMYDMTDEQRDTYLTRGRSNELYLKYNSKQYAEKIEVKKNFNSLFAKYLKRDWVDVDSSSKEDVMAFLEKHEVFLAKPNNASGGHGIEKLYRENYGSLEEIYEYLNGKDFELEELVVQNEEVATVYPGSINTVRIVTLLVEGVPHVIIAIFRIGNGSFVDNFHSGGMATVVDIESGVVQYGAVDHDKNIYLKHPATGTDIKGFKFPDWQKALDMVKEAALVVPEMGYVGWDVAFSKDGPLLIECNDFPGHDIYQLPDPARNKQGVWPLFNNLK